MKRLWFWFTIIAWLLILVHTGLAKVRVCVSPFENLRPRSGLDVPPEDFTKLLLENIKDHPEFEFSFAESKGSLCAGEQNVLLRGEYSMVERESGLNLSYRITAHKSGNQIIQRSFKGTTLDSASRAIQHDLETNIFCQLDLTSVPSGAKINLSGSRLGSTPLAVRILKGSYQFEAIPDEDNYHPETVQLDLSQDSLAREITFRPKAFTLTMEFSTKGDSVFFDDSYVGMTPEVNITAYKRGQHTLSVKKTEKKEKKKEETTWRRKVPFQATYLFINAKYDEPGNDHFRDMYSSFAGGEIGVGRYSDYVKADASLFFLLPTSNPRPHFADASGSTQEMKRVWRFGMDLAFSLILPLGYLKQYSYPVFPQIGMGYQVASLNVDVAGDDWVGYETRAEDDFQFIQVDSENWYYQAGLFFGPLNLGWKRTFDAKYTDFECFFAGAVIKLK